MARVDFGGVFEDVVTREEFSLEQAPDTAGDHSGQIAWIPLRASDSE